VARAVALGAWLRKRGDPAWNAHTVGIIVAVAALAQLFAFQRWEEWVNAALGAWLIASPSLLSFATLSAALWNQILLGMVVGGLAIWTAAMAADGVSARG
jgi:hypothetical protein